MRSLNPIFLLYLKITDIYSKGLSQNLTRRFNHAASGFERGGPQRTPFTKARDIKNTGREL
jgi:hypothetical protein